jgi:hypothetical protein
MEQILLAVLLILKQRRTRILYQFHQVHGQLIHIINQSFNANGLKININANRNESKSIPTKMHASRRHSHNTE